jgi:hypothetical protein
MQYPKILLLSVVFIFISFTSLFAQTELSNAKTCPPLKETFHMFQKGHASFNVELGFSRFQLNDGSNFKPSFGFDFNYYPINKLGFGITSINNYGFGSDVIYPFTQNLILYSSYQLIQHSCSRISISLQAGYIFNREKLKIDDKIEQFASNSPLLGFGLYRPLGKRFYLQGSGRWLLNGGDSYSFASNISIGFRLASWQKK